MVVESINGYSDRQVARAQRFVNADDRAINRLAAKNYKRKHGESDKKFGKTMSVIAASLPVLGFVSGIVSKKGVVGSLAKAAHFAGFLLAGKAVSKGLSLAENKSAKVRKAERKHSGMTSALATAGTLGLAYGADIGINKLAKNEKVGAAIVNGASNLLKKANDLKLAEKAGNLYSKAPKALKTGIDKVMSSNTAKIVLSAGKDVGKAALKSGPTLAVAAILGGVISKSVSIAKNYNTERAKIKDAQFETAKTMVNGLMEENKELKEALSVKEEA